MKLAKSLMASSMLVCMVAKADIPRPPVHSDMERMTVSGSAAAELNKNTPGETLPGDQLRNGGSSYNVFRSSDETFQIVCENTFRSGTGGRAPLRSSVCEITQSKSGRPLPRFVQPPRRMG